MRKKLDEDTKNFAHEAIKALKDSQNEDEESASVKQSKIQKLEKYVEKNAGRDFDIVLSKFLNKPVNQPDGISRAKASEEAIEKILRSPPDSVVPLLEAVGETAIKTNCFGCFGSE